MNSHEPNPNASSQQAIQEPPRKSPWSRKAKMLRLLWGIADVTVWRFSPVFMWGFRRSLLRAFGARVGKGVRVHPSVRIIIPWHIELGDDVVVHERAILYALGRIRVGSGSEIGAMAHICAGTHDYTDPAFTLLREPITIGRDCIIGIAAFIAPRVSLADGTLLHPRCAIYSDTEAGASYIGNPGKHAEQQEPVISAASSEAVSS